jgi:hypothetical protein
MKRIHNISKKFMISLWLTVLWLSTIPNLTIADDNELCNQYWGSCHVEDVRVIRTDEDPNSGLLDTIKNAINWILWVLATVALCICLYWGFKMLTSGADGKWYKDGRTILKNAAIWLAIILLSWMIVSVIFWFVGTLSWGNQVKGEWI